MRYGQTGPVRRLVVVQLAERFLPEKWLLPEYMGLEGRVSNNPETASPQPLRPVNAKRKRQAGGGGCSRRHVWLGHTRFMLLGELRAVGSLS